MKLHLIYCLAFLGLSKIVYAQRTVSGTILEKATGTPVAEANIRLEDTSVGSVSDSKGHFSLTLNDTQIDKKMVISHLGYQTLNLPLAHFKSEIHLEEQVYQIGEVAVRFVDVRKLLIRKWKLDEASVDKLTEESLEHLKQKDPKKYESLSKKPETLKKIVRMIRLVFHQNGTARVKALIVMGSSFEWKLDEDNKSIVLIDKEGHEKNRTISELTENHLVLRQINKEGKVVDFSYVAVD